MTSGKHTKLKEASNMPSFCLASVMLPKREREKKKRNDEYVQTAKAHCVLIISTYKIDQLL